MTQTMPVETDQPTIRYPIRYKIFLVSLVPTVALLAAALLNHQVLTSLGESAEGILSKNYRSIRAAQEARQALEENRNLRLEALEPPRAAAATPPAALQTLQRNLAICRANVTEAGEGDLVDRLAADYARYAAMVQPPPAAGADPWENEGLAEFLALTAEMVQRLDALVAVNEAAMERADEATRQLARRAQRRAAVLFGVIIGGILAWSYFLSYRIARPIMKLAHQLSGTPEGRGVYPQVRVRSRDEIGFLSEAFNRLFRRLEQYDRHRDDILAAEKEKVRRGEEAKGRFIADISHQLKTPMTSLSMSVGMLHAGGGRFDPARAARLVATAHEDCNRLAALINELVDLSRLEAMARPRPKETLEIGAVIRECLAPLRKQADDKGVHLAVDVPADLPPVTIDSFRFPWVITNLVGNALRYTGPGGRIAIGVRRQGRRFYFHCRDTGSGIDPRYLPRIFDRFTQFSERGKSGTVGLGLAIVKDIIEQHGGDVAVESRLGEGTTFTFWIPDLAEEPHGQGPDHR
jgi:signal transduction histidine kinase